MSVDTNAALLESWTRQARIVNLVAEHVTEANKNAKPSEDGWPLYEQLAHIHMVRRFHMRELDAARASSLPSAYIPESHDAMDDLDALREMLKESGLAVGEVMATALAENKQQSGGYEHPVLFLQHLIWHEGWHVGLIFLALRLAGNEIPEEWEEAKVWAEWRQG